MKPYANAKQSGVARYELHADHIILQFSDGGVYLYNLDAPGELHVRHMKALAFLGKGLNSYINKYVRDNYAKRLK